MTDTDRLARIEKLLAQQVTATMRLVELMEEANRADHNWHRLAKGEYVVGTSREIRRIA